MKPNFSQSPEDRLLDELLQEQNQGQDDAFLQQIEAAVDAGVPVLTKRPPSRMPARIAIAAAVMLAAGSVVWWQTQRHREAVVAANDSHAAKEKVKAAQELLELNKAIRDQEEKVEERRKVLATIVRTKGINYQGAGSSYGELREEPIKRGLDAQAYVDAKRDYENNQQALVELKFKQAMIASNNRVAGLAAAEPERAEIVSEKEISPLAMKREAQANKRVESLSDVRGMIVDSREAIPESEPLPELAANNTSPSEHGLSAPADSPQTDKSKAMAGSGAGTGRGAGLGVGGAGKLFGLVPQASDATRPAISRSGDSGGFSFPGETTAEHKTGDRYGSFIDQPWKSSASDPLSTFSIDVDTASYGNVRRMIREGREIPRDAVRIEECINAFSYRYAPPKGDAAFSVGAELAVCPWAPEHQLVRVAIKGREIDAAKRPASNLVFLIDVSGSMQSPDRLPLLKQSMATLVNQLDERDHVAIVVYAGSEGVALPSTRLDAEGRATVLQKLAKLEAGGSTNGGAGIKRAYEIAMQQKIDGGVNRVILATDGDFNVGVTGQSSLVALVKERAKSGVYLTVLGYGSGNLNDSMMDAITRDGNGNYFYIDSEREGRKVFLQNLTGTLVTIAKDVKIQIEFNPAKVGGYRLIGYANRVLRNEDFKNDKVDAGDIGAGHTVTAFYELTPPGAAGGKDDLKYQTTPPKPAGSNEWLTVKLRHKHPEGDASSLTEFPLTGEAAALDKTDTDFQFATAVTLFGMKLRGMDEVGETPWEKVLELAKTGLADDTSEDRAEFVGLLKKLGGSHERIVPPPAEVMPGNRR
jgi:Ca-activated chloride channel family protein